MNNNLLPKISKPKRSDIFEPFNGPFPFKNSNILQNANKDLFEHSMSE